MSEQVEESNISAPADAVTTTEAEAVVQSRLNKPPLSTSTGFFICPPSLSATTKEQYKPTIETSLKSEMEIDVDEVVGEYHEGETSYYFARLGGGICHKFPARPFLQKFRPLVEEYKIKKAAGKLQPFDPSAHYVHPLSRVRMKININKNGATVNISSARSIQRDDISSEHPYSSDSYMSDGTQEDDESSRSNDDSYRGEKPRKSKRSKKRLPHSPRKTRSKTIHVIESDDDIEAEETRPPRRSTRATKKGKTMIDNYSFSEGSQSDNSSDYDTGRKGKGMTRKPKSATVKVCHPAYGIFRDISEIDHDSYPNDAENAPLRKHRSVCEKCHLKPAHQLLSDYSKKKGKGKKRAKAAEDDFEESDEEKFNSLGGWVQCLKCPVSAHWRCLAASQKDAIIKAARDKDRPNDAEMVVDGDDKVSSSIRAKRRELSPQEITNFICGACAKGDICMGCKEVVLDPETVNEQDDRIPEVSDNAKPEVTQELLFRCFTCKRLAHYAHLPTPEDSESNDEATTADIASHYQKQNSWLCADCASYKYDLDKILAWRPYPPDVVEAPRPPNEPAQYKQHLPREYLVKWVGRSYKRTQWVPHMWLLSTAAAKLKNFLIGGTKVNLLDAPVKQGTATSTPADTGTPPIFEPGAVSRSSSTKLTDNPATSSLGAIPDAELRIPPAWKTVDRILNVVLWYSPKSRSSKKGSKKQSPVIESYEEQLKNERTLVLVHGGEPNSNFAGTISEWEEQTGKQLSMEDIDEVAWAFIKWDDLNYDESTWDTPPLRTEKGYSAFETAFQRFIDSRDVIIPRLSKSFIQKFDNRDKNEYKKKHILNDSSELDIGQDPKLKLMPFQVDGFNWLCNNWWIHQPCILADEMGLGKTVQVVTFLGQIATKWQAFPALVVVPNSTITNWIREFERWSPKLRAVPFYGDKKSRDIIKEFELYHNETPAGATKAKFHVLVTTYEAFTNQKDSASVFKSQPRWEVLVVDEGQRLKNDSSLLFKKLNELNSVHRVIMTGTPLNNNIRELFNLMNFLDPEEWHDLEALEKEHEELTEELIKDLHNRLRPYFLRRIKSEVLKLPPKNEVIVPVSMAPLQKEIYRSILSHNSELLQGLTLPNKVSGVTKGRINNVLMQLRKCLQHPYLYAEGIEPPGLDSRESHDKLIDASAKLRLLKILLPKLRERGHRVLLFSQFVIALNVIEDFLVGEGFKFSRLDGSTKGTERQKGMDEFNRAGSDVFIYLLTTRAGGVGINLFSADTVIIFDPDFNPHQDLQAIARAYRYGQEKTCLVFKLMVKESAEERIMQIGKKKLILDHVIVQKMDDDEDNGGSDFQSILTYGAQALFEEDQSARDIIYTDHDIDNLIEKTEKEGDQEATPEGGLSFSFAKIWAADKNSMEEVEDEDQTDSWAQTLQKITEERNKQITQEITSSGRGVRRKAADAAKTKMNIVEDNLGQKSPNKGRKANERETGSDHSAYLGSDNNSDSDDSDFAKEQYIIDDIEITEVNQQQQSTSQYYKVDATYNKPSDVPVPKQNNTKYRCGLCKTRHGVGLGKCPMTERSENLAKYREMIISHANDEPWEDRSAAIRAIDEILHRRGRLSLIAGQPLHPVQKATKGSKTNTHVRPITRTPRENGTCDTQITGTSSRLNATAGSSKRTSSLPPIEQGMKKKHKPSGPACLVCNETVHLIKDCPVVAKGPKSVERAIERLQRVEGMGDTINLLGRILMKQIKATNK